MREGDGVGWSVSSDSETRKVLFFFLKCGKCKSPALNTHMKQLKSTNRGAEAETEPTFSVKVGEGIALN